MGERRKRKSMWDMEEETKQFSEMSEHNSSNDSGHYHEFPASLTFTASKSRDHSGQPFRESNEENPVTRVNGSFIESKHNSPEGKEISGQNRYYQNMYPGFDGTERRKYMRSLKNDRSDFHRHPRRDPSRSPCNSKTNGIPKGRTRSRSPIPPDYIKNQSHKSSDRRSVPDKSSRDCRDFSAGRSPRDSQCRIVPSHNSSRGKDSYSKVTGSDFWDDVSDFCHGENEQLRNKSRNQDRSSIFQGQNNIQRQDHDAAEKNVTTSFFTDVLDEAKDSRNPTHTIPFSGQNLNRNGENVLPVFSNATDGGLNVVRPNPSNGFNGEAQLGACLDLHAQMHNHQEAVPMTEVLETKVTSTFDNVKFRENADTPLSVVDAKPDNAKPDNFGSSKLNQETILADSEVGEGNKSIDGHKKVDDSIGNKDEKAARLFKNCLIEFVKEILKPTWKEGRLSRDVHKTIVKKVVDKITSTVQADHVPKTPDKVDQYLSFSKPKIAKLVQAYVERSLKPTDS